VLDSHPDVHSIDEADYWKRARPIDDYLADPALPAFVAFKLPQEARRVEELAAKYTSIRILWCLRDPRDVVASMVSLTLRHEESKLVWACHPNGAIHELAQAIPALPEDARAKLAPHLERYAALSTTPYEARNRTDAIFTGALCWGVKNEFLKVYRKRQLPLIEVRYEPLVTSPRDTIEQLLASIGLPWSEDVLRHHQLHSGMLIGRTDASRAIDQTKVGRWAQDFSEGELAAIRGVCGELAGELGYQ